MERIFHPVGHGAFYTEKFHDTRNDSLSFTVVYDCGSLSYGALKGIIDATFTEGDKINFLFISHFHYDHINMVQYLKEICDIDYIIVPNLSFGVLVESLVHYAILGTDLVLTNEFVGLLSDVYNRADDKIIMIGTCDANCRMLDITDIPREINNNGRLLSNIEFGFRNWRYRPYVSIDGKTDDLLKEIKKDPHFKDVKWNDVNVHSLFDLIKTVDVDVLKEIYWKVYGNKHNSYSMPVYSGLNCTGRCRKNCHKQGTFSTICHTNCLYMGDYDAKSTNNCDALKRFYGDSWRRIGLIQVPHHGSEHNSDEELYSPNKLCIISSGREDRYGHPNQATINAIRSVGSVHTIVTEDKKTEQKFIYNLK